MIPKRDIPAVILGGILGLAMSFVLSTHGQEASNVKFYGDFSGGLNTFASSVLIADNESPDLQNVTVDRNGAVTRREGFLQINAIAIGGGLQDVNSVYQLEQLDGNKFCVAFSSASGYFSIDGCATFTVFVDSITVDSDVNCDALNDKLYCASNGYNFAFDGSDDFDFAGPADLDYLRVHRNRCLGTGSGAQPDRLYWSNLGDCETWDTLTDFVDVSPQDGDKITGIGEPIYDMIPIYKKFSTWALQGTGPSDWKLVNISKNTGAVNHRSIRNFNNVQLFDSVGPHGGQPGIYAFNGIVIREASKKLRDTLDLSANFNVSFGRRIQDTQADFAAGNVNPEVGMHMDTDISPGSVQPSTFSVIISTNSQYLAGTLVNISTQATANVMQLVQNTSGSFVNAGAESSDDRNWDQQNFTNTSGTPFWGSRYWGGGVSGSCTDEVHFKIVDADDFGIVLVNHTASLSNGQGATVVRLSSTGTARGMVRLYVSYGEQRPPPNLFTDAVSEPFLTPEHVEFSYRDGDGGSTCSLDWDTSESLLITSGTWTSGIFDSKISTPIWGLADFAISSSASQTLGFNVQSSSSATGVFEDTITVTAGLQLTAGASQYFRFILDYGVVSTTEPSPTFSTALIQASNTGYFIHDCFSVGADITSWGLFQAEVTDNDGDVSHAVTFGENCDQVTRTTATWVTQANNVAITIDTAAYLGVKTTFDSFAVMYATALPTLKSVTINFSEGLAAKSASAAVFKNRYHYGAQSPSGSINDVIFVLDENGAWSRFVGIRPRFLNVVNQRFIVADSSKTGGGFLHEMYQTDSDNGAAINAFWESKDFPLGGIWRNKSLDRWYLVHKADNTSLTVTIKSDTGTDKETYSVSLATGAAFGVLKEVVEPTIEGHSFRMRVENNSATAPWEILGIGFEPRDTGAFDD